jgi:succinate dehydrogenase / fumarate reductase, membrane anchor subunit
MATRMITPPKNFETTAWKWMRYSGIALLPLVWIHVLLQDVIVGVHAIDFDYVVFRWSVLGWQVYDILLLAFAFAHGMNGLRQVANDFIHDPRAQKTVAWVIFVLWLVVSAIGAVAIIAAAAKHAAGA